MRYLYISLVTIGLILLLSKLPAKQPAWESYMSTALSHHDTLLPSFLACKECHGSDPEGIASVTKAGKDINVMDDWSVSMKAFAAKDPFWRSQMEYELLYHDSSDLDGCLRCHAPAAYHKYVFQDDNFTLADLHRDSIALEGVQCASCHQMAGFNSVNGLHTYASNGTIKGPYPEPFAGPMQDLFGWPVEYDPAMRSSEACKSCHTVLHETSSGKLIAEQATYFEWEASDFQKQQKECQSCHMPYVFDSIKLATEYPFIEGRIPFARHQFLGANHWMLTALRDQFDEDVRFIPDSIWNVRLDQHKAFLKGSATIRIINVDPVPDDHLISEIEIINLSGHKFPTGYPSRKAIVEFLVIDPESRDTMFHSGDPHDFYRSEETFPHYEQIQMEEQLQVYEFRTLDASNRTNYSLLSADTVRKDNRIPPLGFTEIHNDTFGVKGAASMDVDYANGEGMDRLQYLIATNGGSIFEVQAHLYYLQVQKGWLNTLATTGFSTAVELNEYSEKNRPITLISSDTSFLDLTDMTRPSIPSESKIYPNPVRAGEFIHFKTGSSEEWIQLVNLQGVSRILSVIEQKAVIPNDLPSGVYFCVTKKAVHKLIVE